jgi:hypothetical protein
MVPLEQHLIDDADLRPTQIRRARHTGRGVGLVGLVMENLDRPDGPQKEEEQGSDPDADHLLVVDGVLGLVSGRMLVACAVAAHDYGCLYRIDSAI